MGVVEVIKAYSSHKKQWLVLNYMSVKTGEDQSLHLEIDPYT